jgi:hypothetical protein
MRDSVVLTHLSPLYRDYPLLFQITFVSNKNLIYIIRSGTEEA